MIVLDMWTEPLVTRGEIFKDDIEASGECTVEANPEEFDADIGGSHARRLI